MLHICLCFKVTLASGGALKKQIRRIWCEIQAVSDANQKTWWHLC